MVAIAVCLLVCACIMVGSFRQKRSAKIEAKLHKESQAEMYNERELNNIKIEVTEFETIDGLELNEQTPNHTPMHSPQNTTSTISSTHSRVSSTTSGPSMQRDLRIHIDISDLMMGRDTAMANQVVDTNAFVNGEHKTVSFTPTELSDDHDDSDLYDRPPDHLERDPNTPGHTATYHNYSEGRIR